jgi:hypothetical protein
VVFVHGSWPSRVAARLAAAGMRRDSIETALRRNDLCVVHELAERTAGGAGDGTAAPAVDFEPRPGSPAHLRALELAPGTYARVDPGRAPTPACAREARADRLGTLELEPVVWQTPVPGLENGGPLLFRDLGPEENARVLARHPGAPAFVLLPSATGGGLVPYQDGVTLLWGESGGRAEAQPPPGRAELVRRGDFQDLPGADPVRGERVLGAQLRHRGAVFPGDVPE